jgi:hypothetical protein
MPTPREDQLELVVTQLATIPLEVHLKKNVAYGIHPQMEYSTIAPIHLDIFMRDTTANIPLCDKVLGIYRNISDISCKIPGLHSVGF